MTEDALSPAQLIATVQDPMILVKLGIQAAKEERWGDGAALLAEAYERLTKRGELKSIEVETPFGTSTLKEVVPAHALSYYGLCLAHTVGNYQDGAKFVQIAIRNEPMVGEHYLILARLWQHGRNRRKLVDAILRGLEASPRYIPLRRLAQEVKIRKKPVLPFLSRDNTLNQALGRLRSKMERVRLERDEASSSGPKGRRPSATGRHAISARPVSGVRPVSGTHPVVPGSPGPPVPPSAARRPSKG